jgi:hypothetical protein
MRGAARLACRAAAAASFAQKPMEAAMAEALERVPDLAGPSKGHVSRPHNYPSNFSGSRPAV